MSREEALRNDLKALECLRQRLHAQWKQSKHPGGSPQRDAEGRSRDPDTASAAEYADPRKASESAPAA